MIAFEDLSRYSVFFWIVTDVAVPPYPKALLVFPVDQFHDMLEECMAPVRWTVRGVIIYKIKISQNATKRLETKKRQNNGKDISSPKQQTRLEVSKLVQGVEVKTVRLSSCWTWGEG